MNKLEQLTSEIRKTVPRLMELTDGCKLSPFNVFSAKVISNDKDYVYVLSTNNNCIEKFTNEEINRHFEIIGHEIMLNDVLEWLPNGFGITSGLYTGGFITIDKGNMCYSCIQAVGIDEYKYYRWDLSKPFLKDQSQELINYLHSLIN